MSDHEFTTKDFSAVIQKQIVNAALESLTASDMDWELIAPFLEIARRKCASEFRNHADIRLHRLRAEGDDWVEAEEAYLGIAVADSETGKTWMTETYWLSEIALANPDREQVRLLVAALRRSLAKIEASLADEAEKGLAAPA